MKTTILAAALVALTGGTIALYPEPPASVQQPLPLQHPVQALQGRPRIEAVFVLDTTGSMSGLIQTAKEKIWSIASSMAQADPAPEIRIGLVAYRDRGDSYVTQVIDLSSDLDSVYAALMEFRADGGGDGPESVNQALADAVGRISWSRDQGVYRTLFLVGDAPPHMDYQDDVKYPVTLAAARQQGIVVNAIRCGGDRDTQLAWQRIAELASGNYFEVNQAGSAVAISTPFDADLARLSAELDATRVYYGNAEEKAAGRHKQDASEKLHAGASITARARRAAFNASASGASNLLGDKELVEDVAQGKIDLDRLPETELPAPLQSLPAEERKAKLESLAETRESLRQQIGELNDRRSQYLRDEVSKSGGAEASLDVQLYEVVKEQAAAAAPLSYRDDAPSY